MMQKHIIRVCAYASEPARDALILRYRIEKAKGVPIGELIEICKS